ncbi:MAG: trehalose-phosphatase [Acetobacteraceae bacterium]|nr:trehalose-phosphatase [Acetobacteraceae bacterium]
MRRMRPSFPDLPHSARGMAMLLDFDGTLVDIAATPDAIVVPPGLRETLHGVTTACAGALAIISGRTIDELDAFLHPLRLPIAGEHGAAVRVSPDAPITRPPLPVLPDAWSEAATAMSRQHDGVLLERKQAGFVLHYRRRPDIGAQLHAALAALLGTGSAFEIMPAACAWEVRPRGIDKGVAVRQLMRHSPFRGRAPVFIGDDVTDEDGIAAARALGGSGLRVAEHFGDAAGVRAWLAGLAVPACA